MGRLVVRLLLTLLALAVGGVRSGFAQQPEKARLTGAGVVSVHNAGASDCPYLCNPFGGAAPGIVVGVQVPVAPTFRMGFETGFEQSIQGSQSQRVSLFGSAQLLTTHRDTTVSGLIAWTPHPAARAQPTLVGGGTLAMRHTVRHTVAVSTGTALPPPRGQQPDVTLNNSEFGLVGGIDIPVRISRRFFLIPTLRVHYLFDPDRDQSGVVNRGLSPVVTRLGVGIGVGL